MASLRECARFVREAVADGIYWFALWKEGRSWKTWWFFSEECYYNQGYMEVLHEDAGPLLENVVVFPEECYYNQGYMEVLHEDAERLREIMAADADAVLLNGYYTNIACHENGSLPDRQEFVDALRWQYEDCHLLVSHWNYK